LTGLSLLALATSAYMSWHDLMGGSMIGCGGGSSCDRVLSSRWSSIGGILPVSGLATGAYLAMIIASLSIGPATEAPVRRLAWGAMLVLVGAAAGSAVWFTIVQKWLIGAFCLYCMTTHITGLVLAALIIWQAPRQSCDDSSKVALKNPATTPNVKPAAQTAPKTAKGRTIVSPAQDAYPAAPRRVIGLLPAIGLALVGLALAGILAACQVSITPPAVYRGGESRDTLPAIDPYAVPLIGSPDAPYIVILLFDYKCPHCQEMYFMLDHAIRRYGGNLAFALCPAPLNKQCNPYIPRDVDQYKDSCELAEIGLAVWLSKREAFPAFDRWMFSFESGDSWQPRSLDAARAKAVELVGQAKFEAALADPWIDRYMQICIRIYGNAGGKAVPKLVFGSRWVTPELYEADDLVSILHDILAVPLPSP
jgi:uncharacterized membrane protein/protein-disulfide isomerase